MQHCFNDYFSNWTGRMQFLAHLFIFTLYLLHYISWTFIYVFISDRHFHAHFLYLHWWLVSKYTWIIRTFCWSLGQFAELVVWLFYWINGFVFVFVFTCLNILKNKKKSVKSRSKSYLCLKGGRWEGFRGSHKLPRKQTFFLVPKERPLKNHDTGKVEIFAFILYIIQQPKDCQSNLQYTEALYGRLSGQMTCTEYSLFLELILCTSDGLHFF